MKPVDWFGGKTALVTGAGRGMGLAIARALSARGAQVWACTRDVSALEPAERTAFHAIACDVRREEEVAAAVKTVFVASGRVDILVNAAGVSMPELMDVESVPGELWRRLIDTNLNGTFYFCRETIPLMKKQAAGLVINILSTGAFRVNSGNAPYSASKYAARALSEGLAEENKSSGVKVVSISPGPVNTNIWSHKTRPPTAEARAKMIKPEDIADIVIFLCQQEDYVHIDNITVTPATRISP
jgi:NAD(P)-dependent dehydrogenase (short-subunit alcohol dehydrogenase family)